VIAAVAQLGAGELLAALLPKARSPVSGVGQVLIDLLPGPSADMVIATAEAKDKALLRIGLTLSALASGRLAAGVDAHGRARGRLLLLGEGVVGGAAAASRPENSAGWSQLAGLGAGAAGAGALAVVGRGRRQRRERVVFGAGASTLAAAAALRQRQRASADHRREEVLLPMPSRPAAPVPASAELNIPGITPLFTPNRSFYVTDTTVTAPRVDLKQWRLRICGLVDRELRLSLEELMGMGLVEIDATLVCVHNPVGGDRLGSARWLGVPLGTLLGRAGVRSGSDQVLTRSITGFTAGIPLEMVGDGATPLVAVGMNGEPLMVRNGFPARLVTPGIWGADANTKWLSAIELTTWAQASDYWDARGWPRVPGAVTPGARIDVPADRGALVAGSAIAAGVAWAPRTGVKGVEVSLDGGRWRAARLSPEIAPALWRQWALPWAAEPGVHDLRVRTVSGSEIQTDEPGPPYPRGSSGYHEVRVHVHDPGALPPTWRVRGDQIRADLSGRLHLAAMAPAAWRRQGFPGKPRFVEPLPPARRGMRARLSNRS
jgi:DMSO/TMAO reductase YedYZ molybdopterin-dependent catalytic subunit